VRSGGHSLFYDFILITILFKIFTLVF
jgi:hypothetical protein